MQDYLRLDIGTDSPNVVTAAIEIPKDCTNKYEYDKTRHVFKLDCNLYSPVHYPQDHGFVPQPLTEDVDPLDTWYSMRHRRPQAASMTRSRSVSFA